jgi:hypothetical protein
MMDQQPDGIQEVEGSTPFGTTFLFPDHLRDQHARN